MGITATILGNKKVSDRFKAMKVNGPMAIYRSMLIQMARLADYVRASKLSGQILNRISGNLSRSIHPGASIDGDTVIGTVGTNIRYAYVHEVGGTFDVPAHERMQTMVFGRPMNPPRSVTVGAHKATFPVRAFLRPSLNERKDVITSAIRADLIREMNSAS